MIQVGTFVSNFEQYAQAHSMVVETLSRKDIESAVHLIQSTVRNSGTIWLAGNGGSGSNASHASCDFSKGMSQKSSLRVKAICLNDSTATLSAWTNDTSHEDALAKMCEVFLAKNDLLLLISGSGNSQNITNAAKQSQLMSIPVLALTGFDGGSLKHLANHNIHVPSNDMQVVENIHLMLLHWLLRAF